MIRSPAEKTRFHCWKIDPISDEMILKSAAPLAGLRPWKTKAKIEAAMPTARLNACQNKIKIPA